MNAWHGIISVNSKLFSTEAIIMVRLNPIFTFIILMCLTLPACAQNTNDPGLEYWETFKTAVKNRDKNTLLKLSNIPFATRGTMDDDPEILLDKELFLANIEAILSTDPGLSDNIKTQVDLVLSTEKFSSPGSEFFRVGDLEFVFSNGQWKLVRAYIDADYLTKIPNQ